jgi:hypothetical protein
VRASDVSANSDIRRLNAAVIVFLGVAARIT